MLNTDKRWELYYRIVEAYIRELGHAPGKEDTYQDVPIGKWLSHQRERANLGLLGASYQLRLDALDALASSFAPTPSYSAYAEPQPDGARRPSAPNPIATKYQLQTPMRSPARRVTPPAAVPGRHQAPARPRTLLPVKPPYIRKAPPVIAVSDPAPEPGSTDTVILAPEPVMTTSVVVETMAPEPAAADAAPVLMTEVITGPKLAAVEAEAVEAEAVKAEAVEVEAVEAEAVEVADESTTLTLLAGADHPVPELAVPEISTSPAPAEKPAPEPKPETIIMKEVITVAETPVKKRGKVRDTEGGLTEQEAFRQRLTAIAEFYDEHKRLPRRSEAHLRAGGGSMTWWIWRLPPMLATGTLPQEWRQPLQKTPWWHLIEARAQILRDKENGVDTHQRGKTPTVTPTDDLDTGDAPGRRKRKHVRNPLAAQARVEREARAARSKKVAAKNLPEIGLVQLSEHPMLVDHTYDIGVQRDVDQRNLSSVLAILAERKLSANAWRVRDSEEFRVSTTVNVTDIDDAMSKLEALGYEVMNVTVRRTR